MEPPPPTPPPPQTHTKTSTSKQKQEGKIKLLNNHIIYILRTLVMALQKVCTILVICHQYFFLFPYKFYFNTHLFINSILCSTGKLFIDLLPVMVQAFLLFNNDLFFYSKFLKEKKIKLHEAPIKWEKNL